MREAINPRFALDALRAIDPGGNRDEWHAIGRAAIAAGLTVDDLVEWSRAAANFTGERDVRAAFRGINPNGPTGPGTLWAAALRAGWRPPKEDGTDAPSLPRPAALPAARQAPIAAPIRHEVLSAYGHELWADLQPACGAEVAVSYLQARQCVIPPADGHLRYHPALRHPPSGQESPALVALVTDAVTGRPLTLHRTWIRANGSKAPFEPPRMLLGGHRKAGGVIRLWPDEAVTTGLGVAEGIETALSLAHAFAPVWACIDAGNLATLPVLAGIESLLIAADHDESGTGIAAARACGARWAAAGREVSIAMPATPQTDINDLAREAA